MLVFIVIVGIIVWRAIAHYRRTKDSAPILEGENVTLLQSIKETVLKFKILIGVGSCFMTVGLIVWIYLQVSSYKATYVQRIGQWEYMEPEVWAGHFEEMASLPIPIHPRFFAQHNKCPHFSKRNFLQKLKIFSELTQNNKSEEILTNLTKSSAQSQMFYRKSSFPILITEASSETFSQVKKLVSSMENEMIVQHHWDPVFLIYDMGLTFDEKYELLNCSQCKVVERYPEGLTASHWTPVVLYMTLQRFDSVIWFNSSLHEFNLTTLSDLINRTKERGIQFILDKDRENRMTMEISTQIVMEENIAKEESPRKEVETELKFTDKTIPNMLQENTVNCGDMIPWETIQMISINKNKFTMDVAVKPWVLCSVTGQCVSQQRRCKAVSHLRTRDSSCQLNSHMIDAIFVSLFNNMVNYFYI